MSAGCELGKESQISAHKRLPLKTTGIMEFFVIPSPTSLLFDQPRIVEETKACFEPQQIGVGGNGSVLISCSNNNLYKSFGLDSSLNRCISDYKRTDSRP